MPIFDHEPEVERARRCPLPRPGGWRGRYLVAMVALGLAPLVFAALMSPSSGAAVDARVITWSSALNSALLFVVMAVMYRARARVEEASDELRRLATTDPLTGLGNRRQLWSALQLVEEEHFLNASLLVFDLNDFKWINDTLGHAAGDRVLAAFAVAMQRATRAGSDRLFRTGGDEFVALLTGIDPDDGGCVAMRIFEHFQEELRARAPGAQCTASVGIAARRPDEPALTWLQRADAAMYEAKAREHGRRARGG